MENASKTIIIAGSVIVAILVLSLAVYVYNAASGSLGVASVQIDSIVIEQYNAQYQSYDKAFVTGIEVKECISEVLYNNANSTDDRVFVSGLTVVYKDGTSDEFIKIEKVDGHKVATNNNLPLSKIPNASRFTTSLTICEDGLIEKIIFTMQ